MRLLRIVLDGEEHPHYTLTKEFEQRFDYVENVWWQQHDRISLNSHLIEKSRTGDYDVVFMQIQDDGIIMPDTTRFFSERSLVFNWTGDVKIDLTAYERIGYGIVTLFTNMADVEFMRNKEYQSDYLQTAYDHKIYFRGEKDSKDNIVFCANYYDPKHYCYPLTHTRISIVNRLNSEFGNRFKLYGGNWKQIGIHPEKDAVNNNEEAEIYRSCKIAINCSHFDYGRYFSDRLLREMACGAFVLSHNYQDYEMDFINGKHLVVFDDLDDLVEKCKYYLTHTEEAEKIGREASDYVSKNFRWGNFVDNLIELIKKYKK